MPETSTYGSVARRYAEAVYAIAGDTGTYDQWRADLHSIATLVQIPDVAAFLRSTRPSDADKRTLIQRSLDVAPLAMNLALLLLKRGRLHLAPQIARLYDAMLDRANGIEHARVVTAVPLGDEERQAIADRLRVLTGAREVQIETEVDPSIIGGMIARIGDRLIDGSTRTRLLQLKRTLEGAAR
jgi:F-type H+-transporting ATPase subunit delta